MTMKTVLIIENNSDIRENMIELLELDGYLVLASSNGIEGEQLAKRNHPDIILCDIKMGGLTGYQILFDLKHDNGTSNIPIVFVTCCTEKKEINIALKLGVDGYLCKPFSEDQLLKEIEHCFDK